MAAASNHHVVDPRGLLLAVFSTSLVAMGLAVTAPAHASCLSSPFVSPYAFSGTVTQVANQGRTATVRTHDGRTVTVRGSEAEAAASTTVDRTYQVGLRYEFHPVNDTSPYQDNVCTATHPIAAASAGGSSPRPVGPTGAAPPSTGSSASPWSWLWWLAGLGAVGAAGIGYLRRRRHTRPVHQR